MTIKSTLLAIVCLSVLSFAAIPEMRITTLNNATPQRQNDNGCNTNAGWGGWGGGGGGLMGPYKFPYVKVSEFKLTGTSNRDHEVTRTSKPDSLRLRGNSTSGVDKKPFRIKFGESVSLFGDTAAKSWVLLANHYDGTFALNAMAFEMGKKMNLEFTNRYWFVDLYINNQYKGIYQLTEQVQSHKGRVDLKEKHKGWLAEFDYHDPASDECLQWFNTGSSRYNLPTLIKSPELDDTSFTKNKNDSTQLRFVKSDFLALLNKMAENGFPNNGYRDLIDLESFAKYVLIQLVMDNFDFNSKTQDGAAPGSNFVYKRDECGKIKAGPLWDFDLAAGVTAPSGGMFGGGGTGSFPAHYKTTTDPIIPTQAFYKRLWEDPVFKAKYKKAWIQYKNDFQSMSSIIDNIKTQLEGSIQAKGANTWANNSMNGSGTLTTSQFNTEVQNLKNWWTQRLTWVGQQLGSNANGTDGQLGIDGSKDIAETTPNCNVSSSSKASSSSGTNNGSISSSSSVSSSSANNGSVSSSSTNNGQVTLTCTGLQETVEKGGTINVPTLTCSNGSTATNENWFGRPSGNTSWTTNVASTTTSYTIRLTATCGTASGLSADCGTVTVGAPTPIIPKQVALNIHAQIINKAIVFENLPSNTKIELYNLQGKRIYSAHSGNSQTLKIQIQTGMYIMRATLGSEKKVQRFVVK